jgi:hypothetical protein
MASNNGPLSEGDTPAGDNGLRDRVKRVDVIPVLFVASSLLALGFVALEVPDAPVAWSSICRSSAKPATQRPVLEKQPPASYSGAARPDVRGD